MADIVIARQKVYATLAEFIEEENNFYLHFCSDCCSGRDVYRKKPHFRRFKEQNPQMERRLTRKVSLLSYSHARFPNQELWEASKLMAELVYVSDEYVSRPDGTYDDWFIYR